MPYDIIYIDSEPFALVDVSTPQSPYIIDNLDIGTSIHEIKAFNDYLFVAESSIYPYIFDISDPNSPLLAGYYNTTGIPYSMDISENLMYFADGFSIEILDCSEALPITETIVPDIPDKFQLHPLYPNPFNVNAEIRYSIAKAGEVNLTVFDVQGREVVVLESGYQQPGNHSFIWKAENIPSGIYFVRLAQNGDLKLQKVVLVK